MKGGVFQRGCSYLVLRPGILTVLAPSGPSSLYPNKLTSTSRSVALPVTLLYRSVGFQVNSSSSALGMNQLSEFTNVTSGNVGWKGSEKIGDYITA